MVLHAPDIVRVQRLLGRNDAFDRVASVSHETSEGEIRSFADIGLPAAKEVFGPSQEQALLALVRRGEVTGADLAAKLKIVVEERRNYDPDAALAALQTLAPSRTLMVDTTAHSPNQAAGMMAEFLQNIALR